MFDGCGDEAVVAAVAEASRAEAAAAARRLAAIAELVSRRTPDSSGRASWACDEWDGCAAEIAAALNVSHAMASSQMYLALALRDRLPQVGSLLADGVIGSRLAATIVWHTNLIKDPEALALVDERLARDAREFGPLSVIKTAQAIEAIVERLDPVAARRTRASARSRELVIDTAHSESGTTGLWGRLYATDAATLDRRLLQMAHDVCEDDPRTMAQRRADALGALAAGAARLACSCDNDDCPARGEPDERAAGVVIHVVADAAALEAEPDPHTSGEAPPLPPITPGMTLHEWLASDPEPAPPKGTPAPAGLIAGGPSLPAPLVADLVRRGAQVRPIRHPGADPAPEPGYRPSSALEEFVRCRDMTCRFPNCDRPAQFCDVDHTIAWPQGPTHPSNLKVLCRKHHLLKTFWTAWGDKQLLDGTVIWTSPSGQTYTTHPGSRLFFPALCLPTGEIHTPAAVSKSTSERGVMMPTRRRTRAQDRAYRIETERALNIDDIRATRTDAEHLLTTDHVAEWKAPPPF